MSQVAFQIDDSLKKELLKKSKHQWISLATAFRFMAQAWLEDRMNFGFFPTSQTLIRDKEDQEAYEKAIDELKHWETISLEDLEKKHG